METFRLLNIAIVAILVCECKAQSEEAICIQSHENLFWSRLLQLYFDLKTAGRFIERVGSCPETLTKRDFEYIFNDTTINNYSRGLEVLTYRLHFQHPREIPSDILQMLKNILEMRLSVSDHSKIFQQWLHMAAKLVVISMMTAQPELFEAYGVDEIAESEPAEMELNYLFGELSSKLRDKLVERMKVYRI